MNLPNRLTVARFFLTLGFVAALSVPWRFGNTVALALFIVGSVTDYADGYIARRRGLVTDFGKLMDPLVDKIMITGAFICLTPDIPAWAVVVIISREFLITGLRLLAASKGTVLPAEALGKHKTGWQIATVIFFLLIPALREFNGLGVPSALLDQVQARLGNPLIGVALGLTLYSGIGYLWKNRELLKTQ
ncbi:MAG: CDP-diacylglycerol--glycerol-3-phosphate 3-phosphatidyltransferase [Chthoniobacteraceae bacterium]|nr:CDP-diacylglycerol--glycerol-3-phosphate 3-phosphatidyltransferase [Chthoniobacteraceae bacterium]